MAVRLRRRYVALVLIGLGVGIGLTVLMAARHKKKPSHHRVPKPAPTPVVLIDYVSQVRPILEAHCYRCHGPTTCKAGLRLDTPGGIRKGSDNDVVIVPGDGAHSPLVGVLTGADDLALMPPSGDPLTAEQIALIKAWIDSGAPAPADPVPSTSTPHKTDHWAFQPVPAPSVAVTTGNPIDAFLAVGRTQKGLTPNRPAPKAILLRRVTIDLIGLPPTPEELAVFLADESEDAYEKVVDRLLVSPHYGERWGRHWMDVWRYSDPDGRKAKAAIWWGNVHIWRWRDWVVQSINADKSYDRMVIEMLAGDEAAPDDPAAIAATGFLARNWFKLDRNIWLSNTVEHTGRSFLGLSIGCARCHDHKFDPISQREYFQFRAVFEPHDIRDDPVAGETGPSAFVARAFDAHPEEPTYLFIRGDARYADKSAAIAPGVPGALGTSAFRLAAPAANPKSSGRRLALAQWITDRQNPLTARVAINHIWARHFGQPLVENVADFGIRTPPPVQQSLLDFLAADLMDHGWSMKRIHRTIVTSAAYRMNSSTKGAPAETIAADPDNHFYWRMNSRRMEAEVVRDSLLWLAGALDATAGGPPVDNSRGADTGRRSIYYRYSREDKMPFLTAFDSPGVEECYRRQESIVPQQALALTNSTFSRDQARRIARRLTHESAVLAPKAFVTAAFECVLCRPPEPAEVGVCVRFLSDQERLHADPSQLTPFPPAPLPAPIDPEVVKRVPGLPLVLGSAKALTPVDVVEDPAARAREDLIHALLNHNDFITVR